MSSAALAQPPGVAVGDQCEHQLGERDASAPSPMVRCRFRRAMASNTIVELHACIRHKAIFPNLTL